MGPDLLRKRVCIKRHLGLLIGQKRPANCHNTLSSSSQRLRGTTKHVLLLALRKLFSEDPLSWPKHLPTALLMDRSIVNREIHFSPFEMVNGYKPEIQELPNSLKLIKTEVVPQGYKVFPNY